MAKTLRDNPLWKEANDLAKFMYDEVLKQFAEYNSEKWNTENKIRSASNDMIFYVAQAVGGTMPDPAEYDWSNARKAIFSLQTMYIFGGKHNFITFEPSIVVRMDTMLASIDKEIANCHKVQDSKAKKDLEPWLEKYRLWKEMDS